jgi:hypothetical protein
MLRKLIRLVVNALALWATLNIAMIAYRLIHPEQYEKLRVGLGLPPEEPANTESRKGRE